MTMTLPRTHAEAAPIHVVPSASPNRTDASHEQPLDRLLRQSVRLGIVRALLLHEAMSFTDLKRFLKITDGNLSVHARKLEDAQILTCTKGFKGRFPRTEYRLTSNGRTIVETFLADEVRRDA
jgi:DNA-binding HxlR family transcriptional regulator